MNLALFACLLVVTWLLFDRPEDTESTTAASLVELPAEKVLSLLEQAFLKGQMEALREHPKTMPPFEETWVRPISRKAIVRDPAFADQAEASIELLADAYYRGYSERYDDYFDSSLARSLGYEYGLRFDPVYHKPLNLRLIRAILQPHEAMLRERYGLDSPKWHLFVTAINNGYMDSYGKVKEGVTAGLGEDIGDIGDLIREMRPSGN